MAVTDDVARYRDITRLGSGGMATVTLAEDTMLGRRVALKRVHAGGDARALRRLRREALVGASLSHPNLVSIYDVQIGEDGDLVIVMEYVAGETLQQAIDRSGGLPAALALEILGGVAAALDAIHAKGIVHRDVKPANILLGREGAIKLADLGIALAADRTQITDHGAILGTYAYMAPEQLDGSPATPASDVYALAVVAYEILSGQKARPQPNPLALARAIATEPPPDLCAASPASPPGAAAVLIRGMDADPARRPASAGELVERLGAALRPAPAPRPPAPRAGRAMPTARAGGFRPSPRMIMSALGGLALAGLAVALLDSAGGGPAQTGAAAAKTHRSTAGAARATGGGGAAAAGASAAPGSPAAAVEAFYAHAASHDYAAAWALADQSFRNQLTGYANFVAQQSAVRRITFQQATTTSTGPGTASVAVRTTPELTSGTQHCQGTVAVAQGPGGAWLLHQISINCA